MRIEYNFTSPSCPFTSSPPFTQIPTTFLPTSQNPTTKIQPTSLSTSQIPTTFVPTSQISTTFSSTTQQQTTSLPTTNTLQTFSSSTYFPSSFQQTSNIPSSQNPTTIQQQTNIETTQQIQTNSPSTQIQTTLTMITIQQKTNIATMKNQITSNPTSNQTITSLISSQMISTTSISLNCFYQVPNCQFCSQNPPQFDQTQFNISCSFIQKEWIWIFKNKTSDTIYNNFTIILNGTTNYIEGNFTQTSSGQIVFVVSTNQNKSTGLNVSGCVSINGTIQIVLNTQPQQGTSQFQIIPFCCRKLSICFVFLPIFWFIFHRLPFLIENF